MDVSSASRAFYLLPDVAQQGWLVASNQVYKEAYGAFQERRNIISKHLPMVGVQAQSQIVHPSLVLGLCIRGAVA